LAKTRVSEAVGDVVERLLLSFGFSRQLTVLLDRKPIDPPPVVQLTVDGERDPEKSYMQSTRSSASSSMQRTNFLDC
jgi:hypothetical protein